MPESVTTPPTPRRVVELLLDGITRGAWSALPALYAPDATVELPFAGPAPLRLAGRDAIAAHFERAGRAPLALTVANLTIHETLDPEVVIAEYDYLGRATRSGATFTAANVQIVRVRQGRIVASRDYHDHAAIGRALA